jgi:hypothetical protein
MVQRVELPLMARMPEEREKLSFQQLNEVLGRCPQLKTLQLDSAVPELDAQITNKNRLLAFLALIFYSYHLLIKSASLHKL